MKKLVAINLIVSSIFFIAFQTKSQTTVTLDPNQGWQGYVNVFDLPSAGGGYEFGSTWGMTALTAYYDTATAPYNTLTLIANTNTYNPTDTYWVNADGSGNKTIDASYYVQNDSLEGQTITFSGVCRTNTLVSPYASTVFIKEFNNSYSVINSAVATPVSGQPFSITLTTGAGTHIQYGYETIGPDANPTNVYNLGEVVYQVQYPPIQLSALSSQTAVAGQNVTFTETPTGGAPFVFQWTLNGVNLVNSAHISGATNNTLIISNTTSADVGTYAVNVTNSSNAYGSQSAQLVLIPFAQAQTNLLIDPGFESGVFASSSTAGWVDFSGSSILNTNDFYYFSATPVSVFDGTNCLEVFNGGSYNGVYQDRPAVPGQVYTADGHFLTPSADPITGSNICYMEVQFRDSGGNVLRDYQSFQVGSTFPMDTWVDLQPTNVFSGSSFTPSGTSSFIVSPANTASVRYQITYHTIDGNGEVDVDALNLRLREPVTASALSNGAVKISFPTLYAPTYNVFYKTNLTDASWQTLTSVVGDGTVKTVSDSTASGKRFYIVNTQ